MVGPFCWYVVWYDTKLNSQRAFLHIVVTEYFQRIRISFVGWFNLAKISKICWSLVKSTSVAVFSFQQYFLPTFIEWHFFFYFLFHFHFVTFCLVRYKIRECWKKLAALQLALWRYFELKFFCRVKSLPEQYHFRFCDPVSLLWTENLLVPAHLRRSRFVLLP